jgi:hypothetical protein
MADEITAHDRRRRRCPMLGHDVPFSYCRAPGRRLPCGRIADCWGETFDVGAFIRRHFSQDDIARILAPPKDKAASLIELIEKARKANESGP